MKKNTINKDYALQVIKESYNEYRRYGDLDDSTTIREYVEAQGDSDPGFFRWLFNSDDIEDFGTNLTDDLKQAYNDFLALLD